MIVIAFAALPKLLQQEITYLNTLELRLFTNNVTPDGTFDAGDFIEPADSGYVPVLDVAFGAAVLNGDDQGETTGQAQTWNFAFDEGGFTIFGYYFTDPATGDSLVFSERAAVPFEVTGAGQTYTVTPRKVMQSIPPA